ncbi:low molecular weight protein tyrosine phosphatase family protein [Roseofilum casamattae]|uniref:Phosphotyrosine protein phosphatase I domain-containing protein n=1 Tax=Roseofilum casamattae BLCC-M143 TaxID=3022442 RepID=A0ABT7BZE8_9CYAN|nr:hypothetical protein [Roseofilum casamattae]MDJ1184546.1 hypothetical protein [Roseofilum casamattae BLCC-M143]
MADQKFLFVCSRNQWRSPTAEKIWCNTNGIQVRSAGTSPKARRKISASDVQWADRIFVMEGKHKERLQAQFSNFLQYKPIHVLDIPDSYDYMDEELVEMLTLSISPFIPE